MEFPSFFPINHLHVPCEELRPVGGEEPPLVGLGGDEAHHLGAEHQEAKPRDQREQEAHFPVGPGFLKKVIIFLKKTFVREVDLSYRSPLLSAMKTAIQMTTTLNRDWNLGILNKC